jgi:hypothetical protein
MPPSSIPSVICPHCPSPVDPASMELAADEAGQYRVCPRGDNAVVLTRQHGPAGAAPSRRTEAQSGPRS